MKLLPVVILLGSVFVFAEKHSSFKTSVDRQFEETPEKTPQFINSDSSPKNIIKLTKTKIDGQDIANAFSWKIFKYNISIPEDKYHARLYLDVYQKNKKTGSKDILGITAELKDGTMLIMLPTKDNPRFSAKINNNGKSGDSSGIIDLSDTFGHMIEMQESLSVTIGKPVYLGLIKYHSKLNARFIGGMANIEECIKENVKMNGFHKLIAVRLVLKKHEPIPHCFFADFHRAFKGDTIKEAKKLLHPACISKYKDNKVFYNKVLTNILKPEIKSISGFTISEFTDEKYEYDKSWPVQPDIEIRFGVELKNKEHKNFKYMLKEYKGRYKLLIFP